MGKENVNILITGGAGYIGSILTPALLNEGHKVTVIDNFMYNQASLLDCTYNPKLEIVRGDVRNRELIKEHIKNTNVIIPLACLVGAPLCEKDPIGAKTINYDAIKNILEFRSPSQKIIFPTTNSGYGIGQDDVHCTEETPLNPLSLYGKLKVDIEKELLNSGNCITLRLATVFGTSPRMRMDLLVNDFTYRAVMDRVVVIFEGSFIRNYIHVRDVARAFIHSLNNFETMKDEPYNVGLTEANLSKLELCDEIKKVVPNFVYLESKFGEDIDKRNYLVSNEKIEKTNFKTKYSINLGIQELVKGYQVVRRNLYSNI
jgi:nucleoside-diphosphate-sugar epimerase